MNEHDDQTVPAAAPLAAYAPPAVTELGGLAELTLGGIDGGLSDGWGTAGDVSNTGSPL